MTTTTRTKVAGTTLPWWRQIYNSTAEDPRFDWIFMAALLVAEAILGHFIILKVPYTEIDWIAYMEEVDTYESGERDYLLIRGGTGPLVYPAGFLYLFSCLKRCTDNGTDVRTAQYIFLGFYLLTQAVVLGIYRQCLRSSAPSSSPNQVWIWRCAMGCLCLSKRIHSIFLLRLFNDGPTMLLLYLSILLFNRRQWNLGCVIFSLAVSLKMNVLLFAPGLLLLLLQSSGSLWEVVYRLGFCCALPQLVLGSPFLMTFPVSYLRKAFELDRVFFFKWTVNWKVRLSRTPSPRTSCSPPFVPLVSTRRYIHVQATFRITARFPFGLSRVVSLHPLETCSTSIAKESTQPYIYHFHNDGQQLYRNMFCTDSPLSVLCLVLSFPAVPLADEWTIPHLVAPGDVGRHRIRFSDLSGDSMEFRSVTSSAHGHPRKHTSTTSTR